MLAAAAARSDLSVVASRKVPWRATSRSEFTASRADYLQRRSTSLATTFILGQHTAPGQQRDQPWQMQALQS